MQSHLDSFAEADLLRNPAVLESACGAKIIVSGRELVCFCSNDYMGLANDPQTKAAASQAIETWGVGAGASRLVSGTLQPHVELENRLADFKHTDSAIVTSTGWMANRVAIHALAGTGDIIFCDKLNHASIIDATLSSGARVRSFPHKDAGKLEELLEKNRNNHKRCLIVTDSLFSMDGDIAPLKKLVKLKNKFGAQLIIDEAHATGVLGHGGRGAAQLLGVEDEIDAYVGTLSKALGSLGGFVAGPKVLIETIRNTGRAFIYTTALAPSLCAAAVKALEIIDQQPQRRDRLVQLAEFLRGKLKKSGFDLGNSASQIIPVIIGPADKALQLSTKLFDEGFFIPAIRPPTVPKGTSRLRISLTAKHDKADIERLADLLGQLRSE